MKNKNHCKHIETGFKTLKEARISARELCLQYRYYVADIYKEPDGNYSAGGYLNGKATYVMSIDKAGVRYEWKIVKSKNGQKRKELVKM